MNYEMEADWIVNMLCNYNCIYCFSRSDVESRGVLELPPQQYADFFTKTGKTWMLHMSGGEPFVHNRAIDVMVALSKDHFLSFNTNGTQTERLKRFADLVTPDRVQYFHIGTHLLERERHHGWDVLFANMRMLREAGFMVFGSLVMEKSVILQFESLAKLMWEETGCVLIPKSERSLTDANLYTHEEKELLRGFVDEIISNHPEFLDLYTINPLKDIKYLSGFPDFKGHDCRAGVQFVKIDEFGVIWRCERKEKLGNIAEGWLNLHPAPYKCQEQFCPYYCLKYSLLEGK